MKIQPLGLAVQGLFLMKLSGFMSKAIKLLLTELVSQCRDILTSVFSAVYSCTDFPLN